MMLDTDDIVRQGIGYAQQCPTASPMMFHPWTYKALLVRPTPTSPYYSSFSLRPPTLLIQVARLYRSRIISAGPF